MDTFQFSRLWRYLQTRESREGFFDDFSLGDPLLEHARNLRLNETKLTLRRALSSKYDVTAKLKKCIERRMGEDRQNLIVLFRGIQGQGKSEGAQTVAFWLAEAWIRAHTKKKVTLKNLSEEIHVTFDTAETAALLPKLSEGDDYGFKVKIRQSPAFFVNIGWIDEEIPILYCLASTADANKLIDLSLDAQALKDLSHEVLKRMVSFYRYELQHYEDMIRKYETFAEISLDQYDELLQQVEDIAGDWVEVPEGFNEKLEGKRDNTTRIAVGILAAVVGLFLLFFLLGG
ncbi:MAG: hypothetical protein ACTSU5_12770 [Promethearchaeota archaeon]